MRFEKKEELQRENNAANEAYVFMNRCSHEVLKSFLIVLLGIRMPCIACVMYAC
jgi:uncharacterized membrane protein YukC